MVTQCMGRNHWECLSNKLTSCGFESRPHHECSSILLADRDLVKSDAWFNSTVTKVNWVNGGLLFEKSKFHTPPHPPKTLLMTPNDNTTERRKDEAETDISGSSLHSYHIETNDGFGSFNFFTMAKDHKKALRQLQTKSSDYKRIVKTDRDMVITIKKIG